MLGPLLQVGLRFGLGGSAWALERILRATARRVADQAVWFRGAAERVRHADPVAEPVDPDGRLVAALERYEQTLLKSRESMLGMVRRHGGKPGKYSQRVGTEAAVCAAAYADAFEAVQAFRWELMEQAADADIAAGRFHTFNSADELLAQLQS